MLNSVCNAKNFSTKRTGYRKRPRCSAPPVADTAEHKRVPRSVGNAALWGKVHTGYRKRTDACADVGACFIKQGEPISWNNGFVAYIQYNIVKSGIFCQIAS